MSEKTKNTNCLVGMRCPKCGSLGPFTIRVACTATVYDDGVEDTCDFNWKAGSYCVCVECLHAGNSINFYIDI